MHGQPGRHAAGGSRDAPMLESALSRMLARIDATAEAVGEAFPLSAEPESGKWMTAPDGRWTGGFWVGQLWLAFLATGDAKYRALAESAIGRLASRIERDNVLNGLVFYYGAALGALLHSSPVAADIGKRGAHALASHFKPAPGFIPLGHDSGSLTGDADGETNIDGVPGMGLLWWAGRELGQSDLAETAKRHVERHIELCLRPDGSLFQAAMVDPKNGATLRLYSPRGYAADTSTWARAQSWGLLGFAQAYEWTKDKAFLGAATKAADWWLKAVPSDGVAYWDFNDPAIPNTERDTSATAMSAAAFLKLARLAAEPAQREKYRAAGESTVRALVTGYLSPTHPGDRRPTGMLTEGCWQRNQGMSTRHELVWGDYFLLESLLVLSGRIERII